MIKEIKGKKELYALLIQFCTDYTLDTLKIVKDAQLFCVNRMCLYIWGKNTKGKYCKTCLVHFGGHSVKSLAQQLTFLRTHNVSGQVVVQECGGNCR